MPDQTPSTELSASTPLKILAASTIGIVISFGLCGVAIALKSASGMGTIAIVVFGLSVFGFLVAVIWLIVVLILNAVRKQ
jgi:hypothetical protein